MVINISFKLFILILNSPIDVQIVITDMALQKQTMKTTLVEIARLNSDRLEFTICISTIKFLVTLLTLESFGTSAVPRGYTITAT